MGRGSKQAQRGFGSLLFLGLGLVPVQAQVILTSDRHEVESFGTCLITASHMVDVPRRFEWVVVTPGGGRFTRGGRLGPRNLYQAPRVDSPRIFTVGVRVYDQDPEFAEAPWSWTELEILVRPAKVRIGRVQLPSRWITQEPVTLVAGRTCALEARVDLEAKAKTWTWSIREPQGGTFTRLRTGSRNVYRAPMVLAPRTFQITAREEGTGASGVLPITVVPAPQRHLQAHLLTGKLMGACLGDGWELPAMTWVGPSVRQGVQETGPNWRASAMCHVPGPVAGSEQGFWLVADCYGISRVEMSGAVSRLELKGQFTWDGLAVGEGSGFVCEALAARPPGAGERGPRIVARFRAPNRYTDWEYFQHGCQYLCALAPDGTVSPLAGRSQARALASGQMVYTGRAAEVDFNHVSGMTLDDQGAVHVVDRLCWDRRGASGFGRCLSGGMRRLDPDGSVAWEVAPVGTQAELKEAVAEHRPVLEDPVGLALDPATGVLYTCERNAITAILPPGTAQTLAGNKLVEGFGPQPGALAWPEVPSFNGPSALCFHGGVLYIADRYNCALRAYDPATRRLCTVAGLPGQHVPRPGPLGLFAPHLLPEEAAALGHPTNLCVHGDAATGLVALVALDPGVARLDLGLGPFGQVLELGE